MNFSDYQDFRVAVQKLIEGDDTAGATFSIVTLDLMIGLGEERVYNGDEAVPGLRASTMRTALAIAPASGVYTLPATLLELDSLYFEADRPIEIISLAELRRLGTLSSNASAVYAAQDGEVLKFWPASTSGTVYGSYFAKPAAMRTDTWANQTTLARYPDVFVYAALTEAMGFLGFDSRVPFWQGKWRTAQLTAMRNERSRVYGGSALRMRSR